MCIYLTQDENCELKIPHDDGSKYANICIEINNAFNLAAAKSPKIKDLVIKDVRCQGRRCCFLLSDFTIWTDCPYYEP
jgi:hypothetical protein